MAHLQEIEMFSGQDLLAFGELRAIVAAYSDLEAATLIEHAIQRKEGLLAHNGALVVQTGKFTGRSPKDKYFVQEPSSQEKIWWGSVNQPLSEESFMRLEQRM